MIFNLKITWRHEYGVDLEKETNKNTARSARLEWVDKKWSMHLSQKFISFQCYFTGLHRRGREFQILDVVVRVVWSCKLTSKVHREPSVNNTLGDIHDAKSFRQFELHTDFKGNTPDFFHSACWPELFTIKTVHKNKESSRIIGQTMQIHVCIYIHANIRMYMSTHVHKFDMWYISSDFLWPSSS